MSKRELFLCEFVAENCVKPAVAQLVSRSRTPRRAHRSSSTDIPKV